MFYGVCFCNSFLLFTFVELVANLAAIGAKHVRRQTREELDSALYFNRSGSQVRFSHTDIIMAFKSDC
jgi:hypothetical protein